jgi:hypothetical protein
MWQSKNDEFDEYDRGHAGAVTLVVYGPENELTTKPGGLFQNDPNGKYHEIDFKDVLVTLPGYSGETTTVFAAANGLGSEVNKNDEDEIDNEKESIIQKAKFCGVSLGKYDPKTYSPSPFSAQVKGIVDVKVTEEISKSLSVGDIVAIDLLNPSKGVLMNKAIGTASFTIKKFTSSYGSDWLLKEIREQISDPGYNKKLGTQETTTTAFNIKRDCDSMALGFVNSLLKTLFLGFSESATPAEKLEKLTNNIQQITGDKTDLFSDPQLGIPVLVSSLGKILGVFESDGLLTPKQKDIAFKLHNSMWSPDVDPTVQIGQTENGHLGLDRNKRPKTDLIGYMLSNQLVSPPNLIESFSEYNSFLRGKLVGKVTEKRPHNNNLVTILLFN